jgi:hypothetical protein
MNRSGLVMTLTGVAMLLAALGMLTLMGDPFPMWLIIAGGGVMFIGVGASVRRAPRH